VTIKTNAPRIATTTVTTSASQVYLTMPCKEVWIDNYDNDDIVYARVFTAASAAAALALAEATDAVADADENFVIPFGQRKRVLTSTRDVYVALSLIASDTGVPVSIEGFSSNEYTPNTPQVVKPVGATPALVTTGDDYLDDDAWALSGVAFTGEATITVTYQWQADTAGDLNYADVAAETAATYTPGAGKVGDTVRCEVTGTNTYAATVVYSDGHEVIAH